MATSVPKIEHTVYPNGFHFVHQKSVHGMPICAIHLFCDVGSAFETDELRGIAHFLEHMLFQGTKSKTEYAIFQEYDRIGTQFNAFTTKRFTCFYAKCHIDHAERVIHLFTDIMQNSTLEKPKISKEEKVVIQENRNRLNSYNDIAHEKFESIVYKHTTFENAVDDMSYHTDRPFISQSTLKKWYHWFYQPRNMVLSIVSNKRFPFWTTLLFHSNLTKANFRKKSLTQPKRSLSFPIQDSTARMPQTEVDIILTTKPASSNTHIIFGFRTVNQYSDTKYRFDMIVHILNGMSGRLFTELRQKNNLVYDVQATSEEEEFSGFFAITTKCDPKNTMKVLDTITAICKDLIKHGIKQEEFNIAKNRVFSSHQIMYEDVNTFAKYNGFEYLLFVRNANTPTHYQKTTVEPFQNVSKRFYEPISVSQINTLIKTYFTSENMIVSIVSPKQLSLGKIKTCVKL
jgi:predicted Zn-dependent peptidase